MPNYDSTILGHYKSVAEEAGLSPSATMADGRIRALETALIHEFVDKTSEALPAPRTEPIVLFDVGCGNGYTLSTLASRKIDLNFYGFDFSPDLHALAARQLEGFSNVLGVIQADIRDAGWHGSRLADIIIVQRVLINIMDRHDQKKVLGNILSALRPGGYVLFIEGFESGRRNLNAARAEFDLDEIPPAYHNLLLTDEFFGEEGELDPLELGGWRVPANFLSTHFFAARVLHPVLLGSKPFKHNSLFVTFMSGALLPAIGDFSPIKAFGFRKRLSVDRLGPRSAR